MNKHLKLSLQIFSVLVFTSLIPILLFVENSTKIVWTVVIPIVPVFIVIVGYYNWRDICPLAFFSKISQKLNFFQKYKVPKWFEENFYLFQFSILLLAFAARLVLLNQNELYLALFFTFAVVSAFLTNLIFTGKTWCNFFCPVGVVERIYATSNANQIQYNSECTECTQCKTNCPDMNLERVYWKETTQKQSTIVFYSFSGLVLGFYLYFYLQSGSFLYYFQGSWTSDALAFFSAGFFFAPQIPLIIAAPLTLVLFSVVSFYIFKSIEIFFWNRYKSEQFEYSTLMHRMKAFSAFMAFNIFYAFAGAPAYLAFPLYYAIFHILVVAVSGIMLHKEFYRTHELYKKENAGYGIIQNWSFKEEAPSNYLEAWHRANALPAKEKIKHYKANLIDMLENGDELSHAFAELEKMRESFHISQPESRRAIREVELQSPDLFNPDIEKSPEKRYQQNTYKKILVDALSKNGDIDHTTLKSIQKQFSISDEEHKKIVDDILYSDKKLLASVHELLDKMKSLSILHNKLYNDTTREIMFLKYTLQHEFNILSEDLLMLLNVIYDNPSNNLSFLKNILKYNHMNLAVDYEKENISFMDPSIINAIIEINQLLLESQNDPHENKNIYLIKQLLEHDNISVATASLLNLNNYNTSSYNDIHFDRFLNSEDQDIVNVANKVIEKSEAITTYDEMAYLHNIFLFSTINFTELHALANSTEPLSFLDGSEIVKQGDHGTSLFIITSGEVDVIIDDKKINTLVDGNYFGEIAILGDTNRTATVRAKSNVNTLRLSTQAFKHLIYENPHIGIIVMKEMTNRLLDNNKK